MNDEELKNEIKNHPEQLYRNSNDSDIDIDKLARNMKDWQSEMEQQPWRRIHSREYCLDLVKNVPVKSLDELFSNAEKVREWLEGGE